MRSSTTVVGRRTVAWVLALAILGLAIPVAEAVTSTDERLVLISRSGRQREVETRDIHPCDPGCTGYVFYGPGLELRRASVVRPGDRVRITGLAQYRSANVVVTPITCPAKVVTIVARIARVDTGGKGKFIPLAADGRWTVTMKPGFYALSSSVPRPTEGGGSYRYLHAGLLGIVVSTSRSYGMVAIPRC